MSLNKTREAEANLRTVRERIEKILELNPAPLTEARARSQQSVGTCRDFALLLTSVFRLRGIPARARAGFGAYFTLGRFDDHWICEFWLASESRWVSVDAQLDAFQMEALNIPFNPLDLPRTKFITGAQAWLRCRSNRADPNRFGIFNMKGLDFIKGNLIRDFLALNKVEILPWDDFMLLNKPFHKMTQEEKDLMDRLAVISSGEDQDFALLRAAFTANQKSLLPEYFFQM